MDNPHLLVLAVVVTAIGGLIVWWAGVLAANAAPWFFDSLGYLAVAFVGLALLIPLWRRYRNEGRKSV
ncbi:hypothetical protein [Natrarchaeobius oligotrophus]|uniref:Uncharacterized protein n=1 Tax=Natrarchaeobius chitinivorans TaxID=1679083 RepID=A0A3N6M9I1_NATCH|nr:hypothetical protein [Natrarchaeobius chitinivorans]RQH00424.1 hypothetical protein EA472_11315 [Natrarchaeobius chitinivorans]